MNGGEIGCPKCLANHGQCPRDHCLYELRWHALALRAINAVQRIAKVLGEFSSVLAEFEWPVCPLGPCVSHSGAAALDNAPM